MSKQWWCGRCGRRRPVAPAPLPSPAQGGAMSHAIPGSRRCAVSLMLRCLQILLLALVIAACAPGAATNGEPIPANPLPFDTGTGPGIVDPDAPLITYTSVDGFVPKRLDVEPGTQVRFYNASNETFWPASNIHPTHAILPELDSKRRYLPARHGTSPSKPGDTGASTTIRRPDLAGWSWFEEGKADPRPPAAVH